MVLSLDWGLGEGLLIPHRIKPAFYEMGLGLGQILWNELSGFTKGEDFFLNG
jgi:hypothetical protein